MNTLLTRCRPIVASGILSLIFWVPATGQLTQFTGLEIYRDDADTQLRFHDPGSYWFSVGMDTSDGSKFKIGAGGNIGDANYLVITQSGEVGIGTASPTDRLMVWGGDVSIWNTDAPRFLLARSSGSPITWNFEAGAYVPANGFAIADLTNSVQKFYIESGSAGRVVFPSGNVGIGTTSPASRFHVKDMGSATVATFEGGDTNGLELDLNANTSGGYRYKIGVVDASHPWGSGLYIYSVPTSTVSMFIDGDTNNVGIGTTNPTYKLAVNGAIRAKEVIVETGWSDFVFEPSYRLRPLTEVQEHIETHRRLPGVPSAAEIQENGLLVGEAQTIMMQKIEELTLYLLQLKQANETLQERVAELEVRLEAR